MHNAGDFLEKNTIFPLNFGELILLDHFLLFVIDHDDIAFESISSHGACFFEALIVFL